MPRTRSIAFSELKIGILAVLALVLTATIVIAVGGQGGFFSSRYELKTRFPDVKGLKEGAVVRVAGVEVGQVSAVEFQGAEVEVRLKITEDMQSRITTESRAAIGSLSLLGEPVIDITPSTKGTPLRDGGFVPPGRTSGQISDVADRASLGLEEATRLLQDVRRGRGTVGRLFTDETLYREVQAFVDSAERVAVQLSRGRGTMGRLVNDPAAYNALQASLDNLNAITRRMNAGEGSLGKLLHDEALAKSLTSASSNFNAVTERLSKGQGTAGKLLTDAELYNRLNTVATRLDDLTKRLNEGEGTAGRLLRDRQLYENMNNVVGELRALVTDIRKDPRKYLTVRVSIF